ncbi:hypothetical protein ACFL6U_17005 [Planctomycetota bacterium]
MSPLSTTDKELILDYCLEQISPEQKEHVERLIENNAEAAQMYADVKASLQPLTATDLMEPCPDELAELTVARLVAKAEIPHSNLEKLISQQAQPATLRFAAWQKGVQIAAVAAIVLFGLGIALPALQYARAQQHKQLCMSHLGDIHVGLAQYMQDYNGNLPAVQVANGAPWWKVGDQGQENQSNTRPIWLLVRERQITPEKFECPSRQHGQQVDYDKLNADDYRDFPNKEYVNYSFRVRCNKSQMSMSPDQVLMADTNPLTELIPTNPDSIFNIRLTDEVLSSNSRNHQGKGQSILNGDGSIAFHTSRKIGLSQDDIFALQTMTSGAELKGCEKPDCEQDTFLAP